MASVVVAVVVFVCSVVVFRACSSFCFVRCWCFKCVGVIVCAILKHLHGEPHNLLFIVRDKSFVDQHSSSSVATSMLPSVLDDLPKAPVSQRSKKSDEPKPEKVIHKYGFVITVYPCAKEESVEEEPDTACGPCEHKSL